MKPKAWEILFQTYTDYAESAYSEKVCAKSMAAFNMSQNPTQPSHSKMEFQTYNK